MRNRPRAAAVGAGDAPARTPGHPRPLHGGGRRGRLQCGTDALARDCERRADLDPFGRSARRVQARGGRVGSAHDPLARRLPAGRPDAGPTAAHVRLPLGRAAPLAAARGVACRRGGGDDPRGRIDLVRSAAVHRALPPADGNLHLAPGARVPEPHRPGRQACGPRRVQQGPVSRVRGPRARSHGTVCVARVRAAPCVLPAHS
mmetsp:Transcript_20791/g.35608  ORF Transcript_20791/g.35608 Transcript_20791/m.35608 type:complete len:203 (+) Transcript_20791:660-1268(+)